MVRKIRLLIEGSKAVEEIVPLSWNHKFQTSVVVVEVAGWEGMLERM